jgi:hypothetical protein
VSYPLLITSDWQAVPGVLLSGRQEFIADLGEVYRFDVCDHCGKPIRDHIWFRLVNENTVSHCSEVTS